MLKLVVLNMADIELSEESLQFLVSKPQEVSVTLA